MTVIEMNEHIYQQYPRKVGKVAALKAIDKAAKALAKRDTNGDLIEARRWLYRKVQEYARSPAGQNPDAQFIPHPATWFNQGRYDDDPKEWQRAGNSVSNAQQREHSNAEAGRRVLAARANGRREADRMPPTRGLGSEVDAHNGGDGGLFGRARRLLEG